MNGKWGLKCDYWLRAHWSQHFWLILSRKSLAPCLTLGGTSSLRAVSGVSRLRDCEWGRGCWCSERAGCAVCAGWCGSWERRWRCVKLGTGSLNEWERDTGGADALFFREARWAHWTLWKRKAQKEREWGVVRGREQHRHSETETHDHSQAHTTQDEMEETDIPWTTVQWLELSGVKQPFTEQHKVHHMRGAKAKGLLGITCGSMGLCMLEDSDKEFPLE